MREAELCAGHDPICRALHRRWCPPAAATRRTISVMGTFLALAMIVAGFTVGARTAQAQAATGVITGTVLAENSERPLAGAQIGIQELPGKGAVTDVSGRFRITGLTGQKVTLITRMIGYRPETRAVAVGATNVQFTLAARLVDLNRIVVTGTAGSQESRTIGNSIAKIDATSVVATAPIPNVQDLINGRAPGVVVMPGTGMIGSGSKIRIRGMSTFSLSGDPLIYVDGVRVDNETGSGIAIQAFGSGVVSRLNDFDPDQIESIEILKGPAAATLYGTEAARGVINIITKKGTSEGTQYTFDLQQGSNFFRDAAGRTPTNYWLDPTGTIQSVNVVKTEEARGTPIWRDGQLQKYSASMSGGAGTLHYFMSGGLNTNQGADPTNGQRQFSGRTNIQLIPSAKFDISTSLGYIQGKTTLSCEAGCGGATWGSYFSNPANLAINCPPNADVGCGWGRGFQSSPPEADRAQQDWQDLNRLTGSGTINYRPFSWFSNKFTIGTDFTQEKNQEFLPYLTNDTLAYFWGQNAKGYKYQNRRDITFNTYDYTGSAAFQLTSRLKSTTSFGTQYYTKHISSITAEGDFFPAPGLQTISSAATKPITLDDYLDNNTLGYYAQQQFGLNDRLFFTAAARIDNNSSFGKDVKWVTYPKASLSWVLTEEPFFKNRLPSFVNTFKFRTAYGESGTQPDIFTALRTFAPVPGPNGTPALTPQLLGNPHLGPERGKEIEVGFESSYFNDRIGLDFTYYNTKTKNAILLRGVAPSTGFGGGNQYTNAGEILNRGIEALFTTKLISKASFGWDMNLNLSTNNGKVVKLSGKDTTIVTGSIQQRVGYAPWSFFRERVVSAQYDPTTKKAINVMCDDGKGGSVPCFTNRVVTAPRVFLGRALPATEGSVGSSIRFFNRFHLNTMIDFKTGFVKSNNNLRIRCQIFRTCLENIEPEKYDPKVIAQMQTNGTLVDFVINDGSYASLREVSLGYDVPDSFSRRIGSRSARISFAGRNLHIWTKYPGIDPEAMFLGGSPNFVDQAELPQLTTYVFTAHLTY